MIKISVYKRKIRKYNNYTNEESLNKESLVYVNHTKLFLKKLVLLAMIPELS